LAPTYSTIGFKKYDGIINMQSKVFIIGLLLMGNIYTENDSNNMNEIYTYSLLRAGAVTPKGWIKEQLKQDLTEGYAGKYDKVHSTVAKNVFVNQDLLSKRRIGLRKEWWSGEHEGYWKDGVLRMAFLTDNEFYKEKAIQWIDQLLKNTGKSGYIGIYRDCNKKGCRFNHKKGNGELWATSRMIMALLAYYEFTNDKEVLNAAEKAIQLIMEKYKNKNYFATESKGGGVSHGIGFFENLEWIYRITHNPEYLYFAVKLFKDFNQGNFRDDDLKTENLLKKERLFRKHGAHIAEGLFVPEFIATIEKEDEYEAAAKNVIPKLKKHITPGGAMRCDEWIKGRIGTADERYEYCGIAEMISPLNRMISFTGNLELADLIETMTFNAGQGSRFPVLTGLSYFSKDNRIKINHNEIVRRENYDAAHLAAVCCALNGIRLMPYYIEGMWMKHSRKKELAATLFGPCELKTTINSTPVRIVEKTNYPFSDTITFIVHPKNQTEFNLVIRKPFGCEISLLNIPESAKLEEDADKLIIKNQWKKEDVVQIKFNFSIQHIDQPGSKTVKDQGIYLKRGPLVYSLPFNYKIDTIKEYKNSGFHRYKLKAKDTIGWHYKIDGKDPFEFIPNINKSLKKPWESPSVGLKGFLRDNENIKQPVKLVPMGNTVFRRVTFTVNNN